VNGHFIFDILYLGTVIVAFILVYLRCLVLAERALLYWERSEEFRVAGETLEVELERVAADLYSAEAELRNYLHGEMVEETDADDDIWDDDLHSEIMAMRP